MQIFIHWAKKSASIWQKLIFFGIGVVIFPCLIPYLLVFILPKVDKALGIGSLLVNQVGLVVGVMLIVMGAILAIWTIVIQVTKASGTPFPMVPTQKLITYGPFALCRNPMTLGTILAYSGIALVVGSIASLVAVLFFALLLFLYIKFIEEKELEMRFGDEYVKYKATTPFIIPKVFKRK